jgi:hypothetical protein
MRYYKYQRLQTEHAAETRLAEGQWLEERLKKVKLRMFRVGTECRILRGHRGNI